MSNERPKTTNGAKDELGKFLQRLKWKILNVAENNALKDNRHEINESDINKAKRLILEVSPSLRKWAIRISLAFMFSMILFQLTSILSRLNNLDVYLFYSLLTPNIIEIILLIIISYCFKEDWI